MKKIGKSAATNGEKSSRNFQSISPIKLSDKVGFDGSKRHNFNVRNGSKGDLGKPPKDVKKMSIETKNIGSYKTTPSTDRSPLVARSFGSHGPVLENDEYLEGGDKTSKKGSKKGSQKKDSGPANITINDQSKKSGSVSPINIGKKTPLNKSKLNSTIEPSIGTEASAIEVERLKTQLMLMSKKVQAMDETQAQLDEYKEKHRKAEEQLFKTIEANTSGNNEINELKDEIKELNSENDQLKDKNEQYYNTIQDMKTESQNQKGEIRSLQMKVSSLETTIQALHSKIGGLDDEIKQNEIAQKEAQEDNKQWENKIVELQNQNQKSQKMIKNASEKIQQLCKELKQVQDRDPIYIYRKHDQIDLALSGFINKYPERDRMKIMFLRESEGVYQFGQKKVYIKVENGDQPYVRIGGGYMHVQEFVEYYTEGEVEKIERKNNLIDRWQGKKILQRVATLQSLQATEKKKIQASISPLKQSEMSRELSPIKSAKMRNASRNKSRHKSRGGGESSRGNRNGKKVSPMKNQSMEVNLRKVKPASAKKRLNKSKSQTRNLEEKQEWKE